MLNISTEIRADLQKKYGISDNDYAWIEQMVIENTPHKAGPQWKFAGAFYFATVVMAMIGNILTVQKLEAVSINSLLIDIRRLWTFDSNDSRREGILHVVCYYWDSIGHRNVSKYRRAAK